MIAVSNAHKPLSGKFGLVLDDEFLIALDIQEIMEAAGAQVTCVSSAEQGLATLRHGGPFDFAILDLRLDDGDATSASVAAALAERKIAFVFLTGAHGDDARLKSFPNATVVEKPYQTPILLQAIARALGAA